MVHGVVRGSPTTGSARHGSSMASHRSWRSRSDRLNSNAGNEVIMKRRVFMRSGALALVTMGLSPRFLRRTAFAAELTKASAKGKIFICLFQRGAADALNVVVPHGEKSYYALRPGISIA